MTVVPMLQYSCQQSYVPGRTISPAPPVLDLTEGICIDADEIFESFLLTRMLPVPAALSVFNEARCMGPSHEISSHNMVAPQCQFVGGQSFKLRTLRQNQTSASTSYDRCGNATVTSTTMSPFPTPQILILTAPVASPTPTVRAQNSTYTPPSATSIPVVNYAAKLRLHPGKTALIFFSYLVYIYAFVGARH
ncbi:hypothetical protein LTR66_002264 [Elasticomyces elasticus]|nr:hypothetical protein LTR28_006182 [Elasticomyces elasticus]KAK4998518.1 hypothetical protein LTR66_002264 [Elasticomyces elasticus]